MINWTAIGVGVAILGEIISLIGGAVAITWAFGRMSKQVEVAVKSLEDFVEEYKDERREIHAKLKALWDRQDEMKEDVTILKAKAN